MLYIIHIYCGLTEIKMCVGEGQYVEAWAGPMEW